MKRLRAWWESPRAVLTGMVFALAIIPAIGLALIASQWPTVGWVAIALALTVAALSRPT